MKYVFLICLAFSFLAGCQRDDSIQTYRVSKDVDSSPVGMMPAASSSPPLPSASRDMVAQGAALGLKPAGSSGELTWKTPRGWTEQPPSMMRLGSFQIKGEDGQTVDVSIIPLAGTAGGNLANVNRWRAQLNLRPLTDDGLKRASETIRPSGRTMLLVDFVGQDDSSSSDKKRVIAAIYKQGERTWFFKMMGDEATAEAAKPAFLEFLKTLQFHPA